MIVGIDFPSLFDNDNFKSRRTTGHNMFDPESLISGKEIEQGFTYTNSRRNWYSEEHYRHAVYGDIGVLEILSSAPRIFVEIKHKVNPDRMTPLTPWNISEFLDSELQ